MSLTILRVEHKASGWGMFRHNGGVFDLRDVLVDVVERHAGMPTMPNDFPFALDTYGLPISEPLSGYFCAYKSLEQFSNWVRKDEVKVLTAEGFNVLLLEVSAWREGSKQVFYRKEDILSTKVINSLFYLDSPAL